MNAAETMSKFRQSDGTGKIISLRTYIAEGQRYDGGSRRDDHLASGIRANGYPAANIAEGSPAKAVAYYGRGNTAWPCLQNNPERSQALSGNLHTASTYKEVVKYSLRLVKNRTQRRKSVVQYRHQPTTDEHRTSDAHPISQESDSVSDHSILPQNPQSCIQLSLRQARCLQFAIVDGVVRRGTGKDAFPYPTVKSLVKQSFLAPVWHDYDRYEITDLGRAALKALASK